MVRHSSDPLSPSEWKVMKIVWKLKECAARDVYTIAEVEVGWTPNTVRTLLSRLVEKGFLNTRQIGNSFLYTPAKSFTRTLFDAADDLLDKTFGGKSVPLLSYLVKKSNLTQEEINELKALLDQSEKED